MDIGTLIFCMGLLWIFCEGHGEFEVWKTAEETEMRFDIFQEIRKLRYLRQGFRNYYYGEDMPWIRDWIESKDPWPRNGRCECHTCTQIRDQMKKRAVQE